MKTITNQEVLLDIEKRMVEFETKRVGYVATDLQTPIDETNEEVFIIEKPKFTIVVEDEIDVPEIPKIDFVKSDDFFDMPEKKPVFSLQTSISELNNLLPKKESAGFLKTITDFFKDEPAPKRKIKK